VYELNALLDDPSVKPKAYSELHTHILDLFNEAGIEIMSPHYRAERDGSAPTITKNRELAANEKD
jgi:small-conductance mechanosensitive channel